MIREIQPLSEETFHRFRELIYRETGINMRKNKRILVSNRLRKRILALGMNGYDEYYSFLTAAEEGACELSNFINAVSTNETYFYRGDNHFEIMKRDILPDLFKRKDGIKIWSAGCSTGEEPYTICIIILEAAGLFWKGEISIIATDINTSVLEHARRGVYSGRTLQFLPEGLLKRYFKKVGNEEYQICEGIRERIQFREHNLLKEDPPDRGFDLIFCRNVMIYFDKQTQRRLVDNSFSQALLSDGFLFIGHSESLIGASEVFKYARLHAPVYVFKESEETG